MTIQSLAYTPGPQGEFAHRPIVWGTRGMVGGGTQLTAQAGMRILWQGGNAVDAAVAAAFAAGVLEPSAHYTLGGELAFRLGFEYGLGGLGGGARTARKAGGQRLATC